MYYTDYSNFSQILKIITEEAKSSNNNNNKGSKSKGNSSNSSNNSNSSGSNSSRKGSSSNRSSSNKLTLNKDEVIKLFNEGYYFFYKERGYTKYNYLEKEKYNKDRRNYINTIINRYIANEFNKSNKFGKFKVKAKENKSTKQSEN